MRKITAVLLATSLLLGAPTVGAQPSDVPPDGCQRGYVWREAFAGDHVCVTPQSQALAAEDNATAAENRVSGSGDLCVRGYVWRLAGPQDHVCVTQLTRDEAWRDNSLAASRLATSVRAMPLTPFARMGVPYPPFKQGCHYLHAGEWKEVACASEEDLRKLAVPPPGPANTIHSQLKIVRVPRGRIPYTVPFFWGSVAIQFASDPTSAEEVDLAPPSYSYPTPNRYSIQNNTNPFPCFPCSDGYPLKVSKHGDYGWVQFTYQATPALKGGPGNALVCVWQVDWTVTHNTTPNNPAAYTKLCWPLLTATPLTGAGAQSATAQAEVHGYVLCPASGSDSGCLLTVLAAVPGACGVLPGVPFCGGWVSVSAPDLFGLSGNWTDVSGGIFGYGGGSTASFTHAAIQTTVQAYASTNPLGDPFLQLSAINEVTTVTAESNNLTNAPGIFWCSTSADGCGLIYNSSVP
jgi:hypothetical protein